MGALQAMQFSLLLSLATLVVAKDVEYFVGFDTSVDVAQFIAEHENIKLVKTLKVSGKTILRVAANEDDADIMEDLAKSSGVAYVEPNGLARGECCNAQDAHGSWALDRIDQRDRLNYNDTTSSSAVYNMSNNTGVGVDVYVLDTGIDVSHEEFEGRAKFVYTAEGIENPGEDNFGHGTRVAGIIGSQIYGVAKGVNLLAVKVLNDNNQATWGDIIEGLEWVVENAVPNKSVVILAIGDTGKIQAVTDAVRQVDEAGISIVVSAGNGNTDACGRTLAHINRVITVGAIDIHDQSASFTNWGSCVDVFAPGVGVLTLAPNNKKAMEYGTSTAASYVAGSVALYLGYKPASPKKVRRWVRKVATQDVLTWSSTDHNTSRNALLYVQCDP